MADNFNGPSNNWMGNDLRPVEEIPSQFQQVFAQYPSFNSMQSKILDDVLYTDSSLVVSAPTGCGKTAIFELAIVRLLIKFANEPILENVSKIVYIAPMKALCEERLVDWHRKFSPFGLNVISVTGDSDNFEFQHLSNHHLIITTPEKWDCLTRKWRDNKELVQIIKLFMIDEVHLLNEDRRGSTLETIVCRMKTIQESNTRKEESRNRIRYVAASATIVNVEDIANWIDKPPYVKHYKFTDDYRPVKLNKIVLAYNFNTSYSHFKVNMSLNYKLQCLIQKYSEGKPTLIFCSTRKIVEMTAKHLLQNMTISLRPEQRQRLEQASSSVADVKLRESLVHGIGYHHAGMLPETRRAVESLFRDNQLPILVATSTLAMGVNLPAHLVIVKSTKCFSDGEFRDYTEMAMMQMIGRAGRPQFDTSATALVLTTIKDKDKFEKMVGGLEAIESNLHKHLTEHINAEVVLRTITDLDGALQWLSSTFLHVRAMRNPKHYGLNPGLNSEQVDRKLLEMCQIEVNKLNRGGMLIMHQDATIEPTSTGILMAKYYLAFETMKLFTQMTGHEILQQILAVISRCHEFSDMYLRVNDKKCLNILNKCKNRNTIRFPVNGKIQTLDMKINCIIQAVLGCLDIFDHSILSESVNIMRNSERITSCLIEYLESRGNCYVALLNTIILAKCLKARLWENSPYVSRQLTGIGPVGAGQLVTANRTTFALIAECNARELEMILNKKAPMGNKVLDQVNSLPQYMLTLRHLNDGNALLIVTLRNPGALLDKSKVNRNSLMYLLVGGSNNNILLNEKYTHSYMIENPEVRRTIPLTDDLEMIDANFISQDWVGLDCTETLEVTKKDVSSTAKSYSKAPNVGGSYMQTFMERFLQLKNDSVQSKQVDDVAPNSEDPPSNNFEEKDELPPRVNIISDIRIASPDIEYGDDFFDDFPDTELVNSPLDTKEPESIVNNSSSTPQETSRNSHVDNSQNPGAKLRFNFIHAVGQNTPGSSQGSSRNKIPKKSKSNKPVKSSFTYTPRKTLLHLDNNDKENRSGNVVEDTVNETQHSQQKITWRSPLTAFTPPVKFSPKIDYKTIGSSSSIAATPSFPPPVKFSPKIDYKTVASSSSIAATPSKYKTPRSSSSIVATLSASTRGNCNKVQGTTTPSNQAKHQVIKSPKTFFPLSDMDCSKNDSRDDHISAILENLSDISSQSFLDHMFGVTNSSKVEPPVAEPKSNRSDLSTSSHNLSIDNNKLSRGRRVNNDDVNRRPERLIPTDYYKELISQPLPKKAEEKHKVFSSHFSQPVQPVALKSVSSERVKEFRPQTVTSHNNWEREQIPWSNPGFTSTHPNDYYPGRISTSMFSSPGLPINDHLIPPMPNNNYSPDWSISRDSGFRPSHNRHRDDFYPSSSRHYGSVSPDYSQRDYCKIRRIDPETAMENYNRINTLNAGSQHDWERASRISHHSLRGFREVYQPLRERSIFVPSHYEGSDRFNLCDRSQQREYGYLEPHPDSFEGEDAFSTQNNIDEDPFELNETAPIQSNRSHVQYESVGRNLMPYESVSIQQSPRSQLRYDSAVRNLMPYDKESPRSPCGSASRNVMPYERSSRGQLQYDDAVRNLTPYDRESLRSSLKGDSASRNLMSYESVPTQQSSRSQLKNDGAGRNFGFQGHVSQVYNSQNPGDSYCHILQPSRYPIRSQDYRMDMEERYEPVRSHNFESNRANRSYLISKFLSDGNN